MACSHLRLFGFVLLFAFAVVESLPAVTPQGKEDAASKQLLRAIELASKGSYNKAVASYKKIASRYKGTGAALIAEQRSLPTAFLGQSDLMRNGPSANRVDVVVMGDGYKLGDQNDFDDVAKRVPELFERHRVLGEYISYHNFIRANLRSAEQGVSGYGRKKETALGGFVAGKVQGQVGVDRAKVFQWLAQMRAHDELVIAIVKAGSLGTGGAGIAAIGGRADDTIIHEWGHAFGRLSDEYTAFTGHRGAPRSTINISQHKDPKRAPWAHFIEAKYPGVGMHRGGDGRIKGVWRPTASNCAMAGGNDFCPVCREAMVLRIYRNVDPIDDVEPPEDVPMLSQNGDALAFRADLLQPARHGLRVDWYVLNGQEAIKPSKVGPFDDRRERGVLAKLDSKPAKSDANARGMSKFTLVTKDLTKGDYQVVCRVRDLTQPSGQSHSWVVKDEAQLLQSERCWKVFVR